jgi:hypothetical protein
MATTLQGNQAAPSGSYLNSSSWAIEPLANDGDRLPAGPGTWRRLPTLLALLATPVMGLAFLVFLPLIGILLTLRAALAPAAGLAGNSAVDLAATLSPGWQPGEAHLTGKREEHDRVETQEPPAATGQDLEALHREVEQKRKS